MPGVAAAMRAAIDNTKRGIVCQAMPLPCVQTLIRGEASQAKRCCRRARSQ